MAGLSCEGLVDMNAEWMQSAKCRDAGLDLFFAERGDHIGEARAICNACPVQAECLDYAVVNGIAYGVWGGQSVRERRRARIDGVMSKQTRQRMLWLSEHGWFTHEIAQEFGVTKRTVARYLAKERAR